VPLAMASSTSSFAVGKSLLDVLFNVLECVHVHCFLTVMLLTMMRDCWALNYLLQSFSGLCH
jgi:hypothetical protein